MRPLQPRRHTRTGIPPCIHDVFPVMVLGLVQECLDSRLGEAPSACVQGFFLCPDDGLGIWVGVEVLAQLGPGERV